ncbi:MAG: hypothetical protein HY791_30375 [Deltaproteobacteria bacterium]|nr:hypothetical protein [Deltaproteobacteria bacterium]
MSRPMLAADQLGKLLRELLPVRGGHVSFEFVEVTERDEDLFVIMRLINWEDVRGQLSIRDVKEQEVLLVPRSHRADPERVVEYCRGWVSALEKVFANGDFANGDGPEYLLPHDLIAPKVLGLSKPRSAEAFEAALLVKSRLGRFRRDG